MPVPPFTSGGVDIVALTASQLLCQEVTAMQQLPSLRVSSFMIQDTKLLCDFSTGAPCGRLAFAFKNKNLILIFNILDENKIK